MAGKRSEYIKKDREDMIIDDVKNKVLTMVELKELWKMYQGDCSISTICLYIGIYKEYALECIEAAKWLYGGGLQRLKLERYGIFKKQKRPPNRYFKDDAAKIYQRPLAIYSNKSPYGIAQKGSKESVTVTSMNTF